MSVHEISERYVRDLAALDPNTATYLGVPGHDHQLTDYSPDGHDGRAELARTALRDLRATEAANADEQAAKEVFSERVGLTLERHEAGLDASELNVIASPVHELRQTFDLMPSATEQDWAVISTRLSGMGTALDQVKAALTHSAAQGRTAAIRQVRRVAEQCETWAGQRGGDSFFAGFVAAANTVEGISPTLLTELRTHAEAASAAYAGFGRFLREDLARTAPEKDAVGAETYQLCSRFFTGADLDLQEAYDWGWEEFSRVEAEMKQVAGRIKPGATLAEAAAALDADPRYRVHGQDAFQAWMQDLSDRALADLGGVHFEIPERLMALECRIAPPGGSVGAYYTGPTDDFSRPGRMWWSVPADKEEFSTWREVSTVYHEGVPGHHLQIATAVHEAQRLNTFQRLLCWVSGHGEGWALYAERLMRELGYLNDDGNLLGMLDAHLFRAARVIVDIGMHLELRIPAGSGFHPGERWTPELGLEFMLTRTITDATHVRDEIDRYLGWAGQAPSYKLGERLWLQARDEAKQREGAEFDLKRFHERALRMGAMGLDLLRERLRQA
ncbi:uncharacterized protein (DUF885 family) [Crossiella equi]|uniref:Uncharacterized protein (DUF885 family) n=1 Tax=Crossiella equi TaxID=130796 RepID=A0ABS5AC14_9PSEU|nr:DUF885 domain-containing protein [Crossiella equi]MBP2473739.1 uncharacterized protein (DUF885 family) [Crossiella equi]